MAVAVAIVALLATTGPPESSAATTAKAKPVKCKKNQVAVKIRGKKRCLPIGKAFPAPSDVDHRLAFTQTALGLGMTKSNAAAKAARRALLKAMPEGLAELERLGGVVSRAGSVSGWAQRARCPDAPQPSSSFTTSSGGVNMSASIGPGGASIALEFERGGVTYRFRYETDGLCDSIEVPRCPTASGTVDARGSQRDRAVVQVLQGGQVVSSNSVTVSRETKVHGQVAADALLDYLDVEDMVRIQISVRGASAGNLRSTIKRNVRVDMRSGRYDPSQARVVITGDPALDRSDNSGFGAAVGSAMSKYYRRESGYQGWSRFDRDEQGTFCARIVWDPQTATKTLRRNEPWSFNGHVDADSSAGGGTASDASWEITEQGNGIFSPTSARAQQLTVQVVVTNAGPQLAASAEFRVKSTAGVDIRRYSINTEDVPTINRIAGTFDVETDFGSVFRWAGNVAFNRTSPAIFGGASGFFFVGGGQYTVTASGMDFSGATGCQQSGSQQFSLPPNSGNISVSGTGTTQVAPYEYSFNINAGGGPSDTMDITLHSCPPGAESYEGYVWQDIQVPPLDAHSEGQAISADGIGYAGSYSENQGGATFAQSWSFTGTE